MNKTKTFPSKLNRTVSAPAAKALKHARQVAQQSKNWVTVHNAVFGIEGVAAELYKTPSERTSFSKTTEFKEIWRIIEELQGKGENHLRGLSSANGVVSIRMPRSLHVALLKEAESEGVSLNQLCVGKLAVQLRSSVG